MRKSGAKIKHRLAIKPIGMRNMLAYELPIRAALVALESGIQTKDHLANLYSLGDMAARMTSETHILAHADTVKRLCHQIYESKGCGEMAYLSMQVSVNLLMTWLNKQSNYAISCASHDAIRELSQ